MKKVFKQIAEPPHPDPLRTGSERKAVSPANRQRFQIRRSNFHRTDFW